MATTPHTLGLIINPVAGMGGSVGLKGTDGAALARAVELGARPVAPGRAQRALRRLAATARPAVLTAGPAAMGEAVVREAGLTVERLAGAPAGPATAAHTREAAALMRERGVGLILFVGGDGTARDLHAAIGESVPILGVPSGVKMHSAVFAVSPEAAGQIAALAAGAPAEKLGWRQAEIMDIDEEAARQGRVSARLYGYARVPYERNLVQGMKTGGMAEEAALDGLCREIAAEMAPGVLHILGPGTTTQRVLAHLGLEKTLLGIDAVRDGRLVGRDLAGGEVEALVRHGPARLVVSVVGGQGFIFGRGNQQIGPAAIRAVGRANIIVLATQRKLSALGGPLRVDTGDPALDSALSGYMRVRIAPGEWAIMRVVA